MAIYRAETGTITTEVENKSFLNDVLKGLTAPLKYLQSKYFYDAEGDRLFQHIMKSDEYYLTDCEMEIFTNQTTALANAFIAAHESFDVIELGAGDATKSIHLLKELKKKASFTYYPVDISSHIIDELEKDIPASIEGLPVHGLNGEYIDMIKRCYNISHQPKIILFLGSSIGNFTNGEAKAFLTELQKALLPGDLLLIGFDLKKDPQQILAAYNDKQKITSAFNLNLLTRINRELNADFDVTAFEHYATYNPVTGACKSYLISQKNQVVNICDETISFEKFEPIDMELSQKYSVKEINTLAASAGYIPVEYFYDTNKWFADIILKKG